MITSIIGKIKAIYDSEQISDCMSKRRFVLDYVANPDAKYNKPEPLLFTILENCPVIKDKCNLLSGFKVGDSAEVYFNIKGKQAKFKYKFHNTLECWRINKIKP